MRDPGVSRKLALLKYVRLSREFGGSVEEWRNRPHSEVRFYLHVLNCLDRRKRMEMEQQRMIAEMKAKQRGGRGAW